MSYANEATSPQRSQWERGTTANLNPVMKKQTTVAGGAKAGGSRAAPTPRRSPPLTALRARQAPAPATATAPAPSPASSASHEHSPALCVPMR